MNKVRYILDLNNVLPSAAVRGQVHAQVAGAIAAAEEAKRPKKAANKKQKGSKSKRRVLTVIAIIAAAAAVGAVIFAVTRRAKKPDPQHGGETEPLLLDAYPLRPMYTTDKDYSDLLAAVKYTRLEEDNSILVNTAGISRLKYGYSSDQDADMSKVIMGIYAMSDNGDAENIDFDKIQGVNKRIEQLHDYHYGFDPIIVAAKQAGSFEYLIVIDVNREDDGYFSTHYSSKAGRIFNGVYMFYPDVLEHENADVYKIRFERGHPVIYERKSLHLENFVKYNVNAVTINEIDRFSNTENNMRADIAYSGVTPNDCPYTFALPRTYDTPPLYSEDPLHDTGARLAARVSRSEICQIINRTSNGQWFIPLDVYADDELKLKSIVGINISYTSAIYGTETGKEERRKFVTSQSTINDEAYLYYSPSTSDRPYLHKNFSESLSKLFIFTFKNGVYYSETETSFTKVFDQLLEQNGKTPETQFTAVLPVITPQYGAGFTPFAAEMLKYCMNPVGTGDYFYGFGIKFPPDDTESYTGVRNSYLSSIGISVYSSTEQQTADSDGEECRVYTAGGYAPAGKLTFTYDGYVNGLWNNGVRIYCKCCPPDEFRILMDTDGVAIRVIGPYVGYAK